MPQNAKRPPSARSGCPVLDWMKAQGLPLDRETWAGLAYSKTLAELTAEELTAMPEELQTSARKS